MKFSHIKLIYFLFASLWTASIMAAPLSHMPRPWDNPSYVEKAFIEIAFKQEYSKGIYPLAKWTQPAIYYKVQIDHLKSSPILLEPIKHHFHVLSTLTGIQFIQTNDPQKSQFNIYLTQDRYFKRHINSLIHNSKFATRLARKSNCFGHYVTNAHHSIIKASVVIPVDHAFKRGLYYACIVEETTQVMGLPNDSDWVKPSIANDEYLQEDLSPLDRLFLKILYDPSLKPGMTVKQARPKIRQIIHRLLKQSGA